MTNNEMIKRIIHNYYMDNYELEKALNIEYRTETGRGRFTINNMIDFFPVPAGKIKVIIDILKKAAAPQEPARVLYDHLRRCAEHLSTLRDKQDGATDDSKNTRAELTNAIKKYNANIDALTKIFDFEKVADNNAVKMSKCEVVALVYDPVKKYKLVNYTGKRFIKGGRVFHVYKKGPVCCVIVPACGLACVQYTGAITTAPEYITPELLEKISKFDFTEANNRFNEAIKAADNIVLNNDITNPEPVPAEAETPATAEATQENETQPATAEKKPAENTPAPAEDKKPDQDQTQHAQKPTRPAEATQAPPRPVYIGLLYYGPTRPETRPGGPTTAKKARNNITRVNDYMRPKRPGKRPETAQLYRDPLRLLSPAYITHYSPPGITAAGYYIQTAPGPVAAIYKPYKNYYNTS